MSKIRFGIMGAGGIADYFAKAVKFTDNAQTVAVASKDINRARDFAQRNGIADFCDYESLLSREDIDVVYIATTHNFHYENIKSCLDSGKHVLCEKPMVLTEKDARELFDLARSRNLFLMEATWSRFFPSMRKAYNWIKEGRIGKLRGITGVLGSRCDAPPESRLFNPDLAGGVLYDIGIYLIEISSFLADENIIDAVGKIRCDSRTGVDVDASFVLEFETIDATLRSTFTSPVKECITVSGDNGFVEIPMPHIGDECYLYNDKKELVEHYKHEFPGGYGFVYEIEETANCIKNGRLESDVVPASVTIQCARVFDKLLSKQ